MVASTSSTSGSSAVLNLQSSSGTAKEITDADAAQDRFLKLLVAQLANQDPMNPMDNAQMTSQIAQINTVTSIQQLNATVKGLAEQFSTLQVMQGSALVGRTVLTEGNTLAIDADTRQANGSFELAGDATDVTVQVLTPGGQTVDTIKLGAQAGGRHDFTWDASSYAGSGTPTFTVVAKAGTESVASTAYTRDKVVSVGADSGALKLNLEKAGSVEYAKVKAIL
ncbi:flagellar hook assembly protein FlgD [Xylophilus sp.]|uniref:flagellar hook assembly protein FlgD n=1 Tax=Xylophilus sp. TaxID=2653893 RepID=UPI0013BB8C48|nr:flagellar hook capping FlgD N-terminal domain-containing protein [Xylophilus sp.]KAF1044612.1 MAG: Basal-body rod modification protein FlgD [Xylophilus sp.]